MTLKNTAIKPLVHVFVIGILYLTAPILVAQTSIEEKKLNEGIKPLIGDFLSSKVITGKGFYTVHKHNGKIYFELPPETISKDILIVRDLVGQKILRWELRNQEIHLTVPKVISLAGSVIPIRTVGDRPIGAEEPSILTVFPVLARGKGGEVLIDVTSVFIKNIPGMPGGSKQIDENRSFVNEVRTFPDHIEIEAIQTILGPGDTSPVTFRSLWSIMELPEVPMKPRLFDPRMGFWMDTKQGSNYKIANKAGIIRWRLEKKFPLKSLSDPIKPITFYLDPSIPEKWKPYVKSGIYAWLPAFKAAGFENALLVKEVPDTTAWSVSDIGHSSIRWFDKTDERVLKFIRTEANGGGTVNTVVDERTGEILKADILIFSPYELLRNRYFLRAAPLDSRARQFPFPDSLMGELIQSLVSHEAGHAFGLKDGNYGEFGYSFENMRSSEWLDKMGHTPSIMTYTRSNNLVQPEDNISPSLLVQKVGPADNHSIEWGYTQFPDVHLPEDEIPMLDKIVRKQDSIPWLRYARSEDKAGPYSTHEVADNDQPIKSTVLALKNLRKVLQILPNVALTDYSDNFLLEHLYFRILDQWVKEMLHVNSLIGGFEVQYKSASQIGPVYVSLSADCQRKAMNFLHNEAFQVPYWLVERDISGRFEAEGTITNIGSVQTEVLSDLLNSKRLKRLTEIEISADNKENIYTVAEFLADIRLSIWGELNHKKVAINIFRQELQQAYLLIIKELLKDNFELKLAVTRVKDNYEIPVYIRGALVSELIFLGEDINRAIEKTDNKTLGHLVLAKKIIKDIKD